MTCPRCFAEIGPEGPHETLQDCVAAVVTAIRRTHKLPSPEARMLALCCDSIGDLCRQQSEMSARLNALEERVSGLPDEGWQPTGVSVEDVLVDLHGPEWREGRAKT